MYAAWEGRGVETGARWWHDKFISILKLGCEFDLAVHVFARFQPRASPFLCGWHVERATPTILTHGETLGLVLSQEIGWFIVHQLANAPKNTATRGHVLR